jgi:hypothetical protein
VDRRFSVLQNENTIPQEGLFLIKRTEQPKALETWQSASCPSARLICTFFDDVNKEEGAHAGTDHGLNDCSHFVSQYLASSVLLGGDNKPLHEIHAYNLFQTLHGGSYVKTLAKTVLPEKAERIIAANVLKKGDVIMYSKTESHHHHAVIHRGGGQDRHAHLSEPPLSLHLGQGQ